MSKELENTVEDAFPKNAEEAFQCLEPIDNANPSEALDCLFRLGHNHRKDYINGKHKEDYSIVEQALLKAKEQEKENARKDNLIKYYESIILEHQQILKIIKKKRVNIDELLDCIRLCNTDNEALESYNYKVSLLWNDPNDYLLTYEEFDLLKRWLGR